LAGFCEQVANDAQQLSAAITGVQSKKVADYLTARENLNQLYTWLQIQPDKALPSSFQILFRVQQ
jgi:hypothetical protein